MHAVTGEQLWRFPKKLDRAQVMEQASHKKLSRAATHALFEGEHLDTPLQKAQRARANSRRFDGEGHTETIQCMCASDELELLYSGSADNSVRAVRIQQRSLAAVETEQTWAYHGFYGRVVVSDQLGVAGAPTGAALPSVRVGNGIASAEAGAPQN